MDRDQALKQLDAVADELVRDGKPALAERVRAAVDVFRGDGHDTGVMTPGEAAKLLGVRNAGMVERWAQEGLLETCRVGGRLRVSRHSVERLAESPVVASERAWERQLDDVLAEFDIGDEELPPSDASSRGRAPWDDLSGRPT